MNQMPNMINLASKGLHQSFGLVAKQQTENQTFGIFTVLSLSVIGECEVFKNPQIPPTRENQHI